MNLFPYDSIRKIQSEMIEQVDEIIKTKNHLIVHAPTGLGKTASTIPVALEHAIKHDLTIFFLTSRHTQHEIAIETAKEIKRKHNQEFIVADIIGKKWMCPVPGTNFLMSHEFSEYCKKQKEEEKCEFYLKTKQKNNLTPKAKLIMDGIEKINPCDIETVLDICSGEKLCPYEMTIALSDKAKLIVADYYYIFNPTIRDNFLARTNKSLGKSIVIVDEAHNLPGRIRELMTVRLTVSMLSRAISEAKKNDYLETIYVLEGLIDILRNYAKSYEEVMIDKKDFIEKVNLIKYYEEAIADLQFIGNEIREKQKQSYIGSIALFLDSWQGENEGYARILKNDGKNVMLSYRCLDPSMITKEIIEKTHSTIIMSGTLLPTAMYKDLLGMPESTIEKVYPSPFPEKNKLNLIVPETTTKYTKRGPEMYKRIAEITADMVNLIPGNTAIFFPSYYLRDEVNKFFLNMCKKTTFCEEPGLTKQEKTELLDRFKEYKNPGAVLLGVSSGSFGEGIDLPGDLLKAVIIVGLPLRKPDLETKKLIEYYDHKFGKGWDYGYLFPAFNKCLQSAGRCIRSETDVGLVAYLDERFTWPNYFRCFPEEIELKISKDYSEQIKTFFELS